MILYIWSLETSLPIVINKAIREKDLSKIDTLGPFTTCLSIIVNDAT